MIEHMAVDVLELVPAQCLEHALSCQSPVAQREEFVEPDKREELLLNSVELIKEKNLCKNSIELD